MIPLLGTLRLCLCASYDLGPLAPAGTCTRAGEFLQEIGYLVVRSIPRNQGPEKGQNSRVLEDVATPFVGFRASDSSYFIFRVFYFNYVAL